MVVEEAGGTLERLLESSTLVELSQPELLAGDFRCAGCGYGIVVVRRELPRCPMCGGEDWKQADFASG